MKNRILKNKINQTKQAVQKKNRDGSLTYLFIFTILLILVVGRAFMLEQPQNKTAPEKNLSFSDVIKSDIATMNIRGSKATGELKDGTKYNATIAYDPELLTKISKSGAIVKIDDSKSWMELLATWLPLLIGVLFIWWIFRGIRGGGMPRASSFNPTKITTGKTKTSFSDVAGIETEKKEVMEIVDFLKNPKKFKNLGARVPRGILLSGEPGTGKTLLARAIAGEANVPFFATSGSDFSGIIVGLGVAKIKEIFEMAKRNAPCILFIDEIDAIGQRRSQHSFNDQDREQTLNQLLIEMDGFQNENGIIVIGATNRPDMLDAALLRPGRFDRQVYIELPDLTGRKEILDLYAKKIKIAKDVNLKDVARGTTGFSGADLENLLNEAALHAAGANKKEIGKEDIEEARDKTLMGPKKNRRMRPQDIKLTAYHEAGHAFMSIHYRDLTDPIHKATIIPRGRSLGMVQHLPIDDKVSMTLSEIRANISIYLAGRAAEEIFFGADKITTGAESDIAAATRLARHSITIAGLSKKIGLPAINQITSFGSRTALENASEKTAEAVDNEVKAWLDVGHKDAIKVLTKNKTLVKKLAEELLKRETLTREEIEKIVLKKRVVKK
ncbi:MAG: ATP-dependent zinc metalloprotease FtsH [Alphaproteobacteria bacterium]|jgi:cell division protease FtsH